VYLANAVYYPGGSCTGATYTFAVPLTGCPGGAPVSAARIQVIPGLDPSVYVGTSAMLSDTEPDATLACQDGTNCLTSDAFSLWPEYAYYPVLVALWQH
jgi:hypothetical protein